MSDLELVSLVVGMLMPLVIAVGQQPKLPTWFRPVLTVLACLVAGLLTAWAQGDIDSGKSVLTSVLIIIVAAFSTYQSFWKKTGIAPKLEVLTSPK